MNPKDVIREFDQFLHKREAKFTAVVIGASALSIMGIVKRETVDFDILDPVIPSEIVRLAADFRLETLTKEFELIEGWLNNGPIFLAGALPKGWQKRLQRIFTGKAIQLFTLGRVDLIKTKIFAYCNRHKDVSDIENLRPTEKEIDSSVEWVKSQKEDSFWKELVVERTSYLKERLGYGV